MFKTRCLEGRLRYETDKVVCIDIYAHQNLYHFTSSLTFEKGEFITQVLLSLVNKKYHYIESSKFDYISKTCNGEPINVPKEINEGIISYLKLRERLELDKPQEEQI